LRSTLVLVLSAAQRAGKNGIARLLGEIQRGDDGHAQENQAEEHHVSLQKYGGGRAIQVDSVNIGRHVGSVNMTLGDFLTESAVAMQYVSLHRGNILKTLNILPICANLHCCTAAGAGHLNRRRNYGQSTKLRNMALKSWPRAMSRIPMRACLFLSRPAMTGCCRKPMLPERR
jgi:hypothetical protein